VTRRRIGLLALLAAAALVAGAGTADALAVPWCGTVSAQDRPAALTGRSIRVVYAFPSDGPDRSAELATRISSDIDEIDEWWHGQDPLREPRFDRASFACGPQADVFLLRLSDATATLRPGAGRGERIAAAAKLAIGDSPYEKELVYYDGPVDNPDTCGEGAGRPDGDGIAIVYLGACTDVSSSVVAAHELIHAFGALEVRGPPHACPETRGHPCDSTTDVLYPYASTATLASLVLDYGHDDYYAHGGSWADVQDSLWLRLVSQQARLALAIAGRGSVESDVPGLDCSATCATDWDVGSVLSLEALPGGGQRFVRWSGSCTGSGRCNVTLRAAQSVTALFAPARFGIVLAVAGQGTVTGAGSPCRTVRCARSVTSYMPLRLRAVPAQGWRLAGWSGGCAGRAELCRVPMTKATAVRARFVRR
jgi:hypothetical protein